MGLTLSLSDSDRTYVIHKLNQNRLMSRGNS